MAATSWGVPWGGHLAETASGVESEGRHRGAKGLPAKEQTSSASPKDAALSGFRKAKASQTPSLGDGAQLVILATGARLPLDSSSRAALWYP
jgi:hypothetical protein